jgi:hypothetical protein
MRGRARRYVIAGSVAAGGLLAAGEASANFYINSVVNNSHEPINVESTVAPGKSIPRSSLGWSFYPFTISGPSLGPVKIYDGPKCPGASWAAEIVQGTQKWGFAYEGNGAINIAINADSSVSISGSGTPGGNGRVVPGGCGPVTPTEFVQQGSKLVVPGAEPYQGGPWGVQGGLSISADGGTALLGAWNGVWAFTRSNGAWAPQAGLNPTPTHSSGHVGSLSADGKTALVSDLLGAVMFTRNGSAWTQGARLTPTPNMTPTAPVSGFLSADAKTSLVITGGTTAPQPVWVFTRTGDVWTQHVKLPVSPPGSASVALSGDGDTIMLGGWQLALNAARHNGGVWIFTRSGDAWTQQGDKLTIPGIDDFGCRVALSRDGNTALIGGSVLTGAWIFTRSGGQWTHEGGKLYSGEALGNNYTNVCLPVSLSGDGKTAIVGNEVDGVVNGVLGLGAAFTFVRDAHGAWTEQKHVGTGSDLSAGAGIRQGFSVAMSGDGRTAIVYGPLDNRVRGATWVYAR